MDLLDQVSDTIARYHLVTPGHTVVVGVSGGPDSVCLLHLLWRLQDRYEIALHVAHLQHGIRGADAAADAAFVRQLATDWQLPCTIEERDVPALAAQWRMAVEEAARVARYSFLVTLAAQLGAAEIAVAHHADDQTETVLMHLLRGSGLAGLRGMRLATPLTDLRLDAAAHHVLRALDRPLRLVRPFLETPRAEIESYMQAWGLPSRFDRSNLDTTYFRNRLRHELLPIMESYNPNIREVLRRTARVLADEYDYLQQAMKAAWDKVVSAEEAQAITFRLAAWQELPVNLQRATLREAIHRLRPPLRNINWIHIENALAVLQGGNTGAMATLPQKLLARIGYGQFVVADEEYALRQIGAEAFVDQPWLAVSRVDLNVPGTTLLPGSPWQAQVEVIPRAALPEDALTSTHPQEAFLDLDAVGTELALRAREPGDRLQPLGMGGRWKSVREIMINDKIPSAWRDRVPLLVSPAQIVWMGGGRVDERAKIRPSTSSVLHVRFTRKAEDTDEDP